MGIGRQQTLDCFQSDDLIGLGMEAGGVRRRLHPEGVVTYVVDRAVSCAGSTFDAELTAAVERGATGVRLSLPAEGASTVAELENSLLAAQRSFPSLGLHGLSASEILTLSHEAGLDPRETLTRLHAAGLQSLSGSDAGILDDAAPTTRQCTSAAWIELHRTAHRLGLPSTAAMRFGMDESLEQRSAHLETLQHLQEETGGFIAFIPLAAARERLEEATAVEYLKTLAICRMALDTIPHVEADWATQGLKVLQLALRFGADDIGSTMPAQASAPFDGITEEDLRRVIRGAGFRPVERDPVYRTLFVS